MPSYVARVDFGPGHALIAALEAAWAGDDDALAALVRGGLGEQPLAVMVAEYGASRVQSMLLVVSGIADLDGAEQQEALAVLREGLVSHMTMVALSMMSGWARSAGDDVGMTGDLTRSVLQAILSYTTDGDDPELVRALFAHLRVHHHVLKL
ncbi:hypothetical protein [Streptomyces tauricus]|uniref:hypothetical protein n=1 Tax=Streptomyces tauricus TaxID=68274 RepID=UPI00382DBDFF